MLDKNQQKDDLERVKRIVYSERRYYLIIGVMSKLLPMHAITNCRLNSNEASLFMALAIRGILNYVKMASGNNEEWKEFYNHIISSAVKEKIHDDISGEQIPNVSSIDEDNERSF